MANDLSGALLVQNGLGTPFGAASRSNGIWSVKTATAFAPIAAVPTTTANLELWNGSQNLEYEVVDIFAFQLLSTAATQTYGIWAQVQTKASPSVTALNVFSLNTGLSYSGALAGGRLVTGVQTTVVDNGWAPFGPVQSWGTAAATPGNSWEAPVNGKLSFGPGVSLCVAIVGSLATASSFQMGVRVLERPVSTGTAPTVQP